MLGMYIARTAALLGVAIAGIWPVSSHAATMRVLACENCSPMQEEQKALNAPGRGFLFVANVANNRIRKFEIIVTAEDNRAAAGAAKARAATATRIGTTTDAVEGGVGTNATIVREAWEYAVDANIKRIFDTIVSLENRVPGVVSGQRALEAPIRGIGLTPGPIGPRPHDPREIAWDSSAPRGAAYNDFMDRVRGQLSDRTSTERISPELADLVHGVQGQFRSASISVGTGDASFDISWERVSPTVELKLCDDDGNCVTIIVKKEGNYVQVTYEGVNDKFNVSLPTREQARNLDLAWRANGREGADAYANWMRSRRLGTVDYVGSSQAGCGFGYLLACVRIEGTTMLACQVHCR